MTPRCHTLRIEKGEQGFSLIEGLIAAAIVAVAFIAISSLFPTAYSNITYGGNQTLAASYAQAKIEQLKNLSFDAITTTTCASASEDLGNGFSRQCDLITNVGVVGLPGDLKKGKVTVTWPGQFRPGTFSADTLFTR